MPKNHFTAVVEVTEVTFTEVPGSTRLDPKMSERHTEQVLHVVVRADSLEDIQAKAQGVLTEGLT